MMLRTCGRTGVWGKVHEHSSTFTALPWRKNQCRGYFFEEDAPAAACTCTGTTSMILSAIGS